MDRLRQLLEENGVSPDSSAGRILYWIVDHPVHSIVALILFFIGAMVHALLGLILASVWIFLSTRNSLGFIRNLPNTQTHIPAPTNGHDNRHWLEKLGVTTDSATALSLFWVLNIAVPAIVAIMLLMLGSKFTVGTGLVMAGLWICFAIKISIRTVEPDEFGAIYFLGLPLFTIYSGPYFIFPRLFHLEVDSNADMVFVYSAMTMENTKLIISPDLVANSDLFIVDEVTTGSPQSAHWSESGFSLEQRKAIESDPLHTQVVLRPVVVVTAKKRNYTLFRKNVAGKTALERRQEFGRRAQFIVWSAANEEMKKYTLAMLIELMTGTKLNEKVTIDCEQLAGGFGGGHISDTGVDIVDARVVALGADKKIHTAQNEATAEKFNAEKARLVGVGLKLQEMEVALGKREMIEQLGQGTANALLAKIKVAHEQGYDLKMIGEIEAKIKAAEKASNVNYYNFDLKAIGEIAKQLKSNS